MVSEKLFQGRYSSAGVFQLHRVAADEPAPRNGNYARYLDPPIEDEDLCVAALCGNSHVHFAGCQDHYEWYPLFFSEPCAASSTPGSLENASTKSVLRIKRVALP